MTSNAPAGDRLLGTLRSAEGKGVVRVEDRFDTDVDDLWSALTDPGRLGDWIGEVEGDLRLGGEFRFRFFASGSEGTGRVEACELPRRLLLTMALGEPDEDVIEATLATDGDQTILVWEERGMSLDQLAAYGAGVRMHVEDLARLPGRARTTRCSRPVRRSVRYLPTVGRERRLVRKLSKTQPDAGGGQRSGVPLRVLQLVARRRAGSSVSSSRVGAERIAELRVPQSASLRADGGEDGDRRPLRDGVEQARPR